MKAKHLFVIDMESLFKMHLGMEKVHAGIGGAMMILYSKTGIKSI